MRPAHRTFGMAWLSSRTLVKHQTVVLVLYNTNATELYTGSHFSSVLYPSLSPKDVLKVFHKSVTLNIVKCHKDLRGGSGSPSTDLRTRVTDKGE